MKIDVGINVALRDAGAEAKRIEAAGYDGAFSFEIAHDPFLPLALAATQTKRIALGTAIAVAFARNPMSLAVTASDLHRLSGGRLILGLGSQIKPHITKRFSMPWSQPARRMRELILAMRAIWAAWHDGTPLRFRGEFYRHTLMTPMFDQGPSPCGDPRIFLAAVGPEMTAVAGEVADGLVAHAFTTPEYFRAVTLPNLERGLAASGRSRADVEITMPVFVVTGRDEAEVEAKAVATRQQLAFYGSTPAYRGVLEHHGWGELGDELNRLSKQGEWQRMGALIDDEVLQAFAVVGDPAGAAKQLRDRYGGLLDRVLLGLAGDDHEADAAFVEALRDA
ncbi:MAG TPA: LLM class F420-dependent oxidoreductase [Acidimicrobiales bacterium]